MFKKIFYWKLNYYQKCIVHLWLHRLKNLTTIIHACLYHPKNLRTIMLANFHYKRNFTASKITPINKGFTLIEVLIALLVLAIALMAIIKASHTTLTSESYLEDKLEAHWIATNTLNKIQLGLINAPLEKSPIKMFNKTFFQSASIFHNPIEHIDRINITVYNQNQQKLLFITGFKRLN